MIQGKMLNQAHVAELYDTIADCLGTPEGVTPEQVTDIMQRIMSGEYQVWLGQTMGEDDTFKPFGMALSRIVERNGVRSLNVGHLVGGSKMVRPEMWKEALGDMAKFAKSERCTAITADTSLWQQVDFLRRVGFDLSVAYVTMEV
jgi:hypothetical protein